MADNTPPLASSPAPTVAQPVPASTTPLGGMDWAGATIPNLDWRAAPADGDKAPFVGGRAYQRYKMPVPLGVLAALGRVADLSGAPGEASDVASDPLYGDTRLTISLNSFNTIQLRPLAAAQTAINATGQLIRFWTKPIANVDPRLNSYKIRLYSTGTPTAPGADYHEFNASGTIREAQKSGEQRWGSFTIHSSLFTAVGAGANLGALTFAIVEVQANSSAGMTLAVGNVEVIANANAKAKFIFGFDDLNPATVTYASRVLAKYGFRAVLYMSNIIPAQFNQPGSLTSAQVKNLHDNLGWQIASQAWTTENNTGVGGLDVISADQRTAEMSRIRNFHNSLGLTGGSHGSYFSNVGPTNMTTYGMFRQNFRSARAYYDMRNSVPVETYPFGDPMRIRAMGAGEFWAGNPATLFTTDWKNHVDRAIAQKGVGFLVFHNGLSGNQGSNWLPAFDALCAYLDANRGLIDVVTEEDLVQP